MITHNDYVRLTEGWTEPIYQEWKTIEERLYFLAPHLTVFHDKTVLEIGCNAGIQIALIMQHAKSYTGIEPDAHYHTQACLLRSHLDGSKIQVINTGVREALETYVLGFNAFFGSNILYWLSDAELNLLKYEILYKCDRVVILTRAKERKTQYNSRFLNRQKSVEEFLQESGFIVTSFTLPLHRVNGSYAGGYFVTVGTK